MNILDYASIAGLKPKLGSSGQYNSPCPVCGGNDRFIISPKVRKYGSAFEGMYWCRQCGISGSTVDFAVHFLGYDFKKAADEVRGYEFNPEEKPRYSPIQKEQIKLPPEIWIKNTREFVLDAHEKILLRPDTLAYLEDRGLPLEAVKKYKFGWCEEDLNFKREDWGLEKEFTEDGREKSLWLPRGIVIPHISRGGHILRFKIRRDGVHEKKYINISGSMKGMWCFGVYPAVCFVVESELDAFTIDFNVGDYASCIAAGSNIHNPDQIAHFKASKSSLLVICNDNDEAGDNMWIKWKKLYPKAKRYPTPLAKDLGDAIKSKQFDAKEFLLNANSATRNQ